MIPPTSVLLAYWSRLVAFFSYKRLECPASTEWRSIDDLPEDSGEESEWEIRCIVVWQDAENPTDTGSEITCLAHIRDRDYHDDRYNKPVWRSLMDAPPFSYGYGQVYLMRL
jgi:hypothetical protein